MDLKVLPSTLSGNVSVPESKSVTHRLIIAYALSQLQKKDNQSNSNSLEKLENSLKNPSDDILATLDCCKSLLNRTPAANCRNSGTTFRLLLPVFSVLFNKFTLTVGSQLSKRPIDTLAEILNLGGCNIICDDLSFHGNGQFKGGTYTLPGNISSQYISALLFALPLTKEGGTIEITTALESRPYVDLTLKVLKDFKIKVHESTSRKNNLDLTTFHIPGDQKYICPYEKEFILEKDWSSAAFWYAANYTGQSINVEHMDFTSLQGDKEILNILKQFENNEHITVDTQHIPDLVPILAIAASYRTPGLTVSFTNTHRLKIKESDRQMSTINLIRSLGGIASENHNGFTITSTDGLTGGTVETYDDHRIAMAAAIGACKSHEGATIKNYTCVDKSYPDFFNHLIQLGGKIAKL